VEAGGVAANLHWTCEGKGFASLQILISRIFSAEAEAASLASDIRFRY
jgi:hypothetical protein